MVFFSCILLWPYAGGSLHQALGGLADRCLAFWTRGPDLAHQLHRALFHPCTAPHSSPSPRGVDFSLWPWCCGSGCSEKGPVAISVCV